MVGVEGALFGFEGSTRSFLGLNCQGFVMLLPLAVLSLLEGAIGSSTLGKLELMAQTMQPQS